MASFRFNITLNESLLRRCNRAYWRAQFRWLPPKFDGAVFAVLAGAGGIAYLLWRSYGVTLGLWMAGLTAVLVVAFPVLLAGIAAVGYLASWRRIETNFGGFYPRDRHIPVVVDDERLVAGAGAGKQSFAWSAFTGVSEHDDFWLLQLARRDWFPLPTDGVDREILNFIRARIAVNGSG